MKKEQIRMLTESGVMVALAFILNFIKVIDMPFGGSVTAFSMVPVIIIAYRYAKNLSWDLLTAFLFGALQLLTGLDALRKSVSWQALIAVIFLDYIIAFTVLGLAGIFKKRFKTQWGGLMAGAGLACLLRYLCHVISGCTVWAGVSIPTSDGLWYSLLYNAAYMIPETLLTLGACFYIGRLLDLDTLKGIHREEKGGALAAISWLVGIAAVIFDGIYLFMQMQNEDGFDITLVQGSHLFLALAVLAAAALLILILTLIQKKMARH